MNNVIQLVWMPTKDIKTTFYQPSHEKEVVQSVSKANKLILPVTHACVHKGSNELIAQGIYLQVALEEGQEKIQVAIVDFPTDYLLQVVATHWEAPKQLAKKAPLITILKDYYSIKKKGVGAIFREDAEDMKLNEFVAAILGTNRTYLAQIEAIYDFQPALLDKVDEGEVSLPDAFAVVPKKTKKGGEKQPKRGESKVIAKNYLKPVEDVGQLTAGEQKRIVDNLPDRLGVNLENLQLDSKLSVFRQYTYNDVFQGFYITYEYEGRAVITQIAEMDSLKELLVA